MCDTFLMALQLQRAEPARKAQGVLCISAPPLQPCLWPFFFVFVNISQGWVVGFQSSSLKGLGSHFLCTRSCVCIQMLELYPNKVVSDPSVMKPALKAADRDCWGGLCGGHVPSAGELPARAQLRIMRVITH